MPVGVIVIPMSMLISDIVGQLAGGQLSARDHVESCLSAMDSEDGRRAFISVAADTARQTADQIDTLRRDGRPLPAFAGVSLSVKDLFDMAGVVTRAGSRVLDSAAPASDDATVVARLKAAGFNIVGRTNMTEFAYSGLGMNPHHGNPRSPYGRDQGDGYVAGGSSSGSAVSICDGMAAATIGVAETDNAWRPNVSNLLASSAMPSAASVTVPSAPAAEASTVESVGSSSSESRFGAAIATIAASWALLRLPAIVSSVRLAARPSLPHRRSSGPSARAS